MLSRVDVESRAFSPSGPRPVTKSDHTDPAAQLVPSPESCHAHLAQQRRSLVKCCWSSRLLRPSLYYPTMARTWGVLLSRSFRCTTSVARHSPFTAFWGKFDSLYIEADLGRGSLSHIVICRCLLGCSTLQRINAWYIYRLLGRLTNLTGTSGGTTSEWRKEFQIRFVGGWL